MKSLRRYVDRIKPNFQEGGKYEKLQSTFEAFEAFLFVPNKTSQIGTHIHDAIDMKRTMAIVVFALLPATLFGIYNIGYQHFVSLNEIYTVGFWQIFWFGFIEFLPLVVVSYVVGLTIEFASAQIRGHKVNEGYLVTGMLIPLIMPVDVPLWMLAVAIAFAVILGKEIFGGTGMNIFNPALVARAFIFFSYPSQMSGTSVWIADKPDAFSGATPLSNIALGNLSMPDFHDLFFGFIPGSIGETSTFCILIGALILLITGIASFKIMFSVFLGGYFMSLVVNFTNINFYSQIPAYEHLLLGGFAFGAVFMATDPVTASQTNTGKYIYGFLIGLLAILIRVVNPAYPEGMMFAILIMNLFAPLIDHYIVQANINKRLKRQT
ncbi:MAG: NADH:ubiquinone reductase (Na(+)-transporting) subunit B [Bacteroidales bacterium]|nr:NADH:ubiquinone reductase (Na(+)-transporting) subunit B [Bacteroidales bacterium]